jgi:hypothetical protein
MAFASQGRTTIKVKHDFSVGTNIYGLIVAPSGSRKDNAFEKGIGPLKEVMQEIRAKASVTLLDDIKDIDSRQAQLDKNKKQIIKERPENMSDLLSEVNKELSALRREQKGLNAQRLDCVFESGSNEMLLKMCESNQDTGILLLQSEMVNLIGMLEKKGNETMRSTILKLANGNESTSHRTIGGSNATIDRLIGTLFGGIQTDVLNQIICDARRGVRNDGFIQRFLLSFPNVEVQRMKDIEEPLNSIPIKNTLHRYLCDTDLKEVKLGPQQLNFFLDFDYNLRLTLEKKEGVIRSFQSKYTGALPKIAYLLYALSDTQNKVVREIPMEFMQRAEVYLKHSTICLDLFSSRTNYLDLSNACDSIMSVFKGEVAGSGIKMQNLMRFSGVRSTTLMDDAIDMLEETNWVKMDKQTRQIFFNPRIR